MYKKIVGMVLTAAMIFTLLTGFFTSFLFGGAIYQVTKAEKHGKKILFFHDHHIEGDNSIISGTRSYKVREVANWQRPILYRLFNEDILESNQNATLYLEWRNGIVPMRYGSLCKALSQSNYDPKKGFASFDDGEDFFGHYFCWPYMCPVKKENQDPVFRFTTIKNCDGRDYAHDTILRVLGRGLELADIKRDLLKQPQNKQLQELYTKKINEYRGSYYVKDIQELGKNWFEDASGEIMRAFNQVKPVMTKKCAKELLDSINAKHDHCKALLRKVTASTDMSNLFENMIKLLETQSGPQTIEKLHDALLQFACQIVDIVLLKDLLTNSDPLQVVYCGGNHADALQELLEKAGCKITLFNTMKTHQLVSDDEFLYQKLRDFTCGKSSTKLKKQAKTTAKKSSFWNDAYECCLQLPMSMSTASSAHQSPNTFLHYAAEDGNQKMIEFLVNECHADPSVVNSAGQTPLQIVEARQPQLASSLSKTLTA